MSYKYKKTKRVTPLKNGPTVPVSTVTFLLNFSKSLEQNKTKLKFPILHRN
ncbi:MAG: hypothetical protein ACKO68_06665 [Bacteroidota bacterium]